MPRKAAVEFKANHNLIRPVDIFTVVKRMGIKIEHYSDPQFSFPFSIKYRGEYTIFLPHGVNDCYCVARELGHIVLGHFDCPDVDTLLEDRLTPQLRSAFNRQAEVFADELSREPLAANG